MPGVETPHLPAIDQISPRPPLRRFCQPGEHPGNFRRIVLPIAIEHHDRRRAAAGKADFERRRLAQAPSLTDPLHSGVCGGRRGDLLPRAIG